MTVVANWRRVTFTRLVRPIHRPDVRADRARRRAACLRRRARASASHLRRPVRPLLRGRVRRAPRRAAGSLGSRPVSAAGKGGRVARVKSRYLAAALPAPRYTGLRHDLHCWLGGHELQGVSRHDRPAAGLDDLPGRHLRRETRHGRNQGWLRVRLRRQILEHEARMLSCAPELLKAPGETYVAINDWGLQRRYRRGLPLVADPQGEGRRSPRCLQRVEPLGSSPAARS